MNGQWWPDAWRKGTIWRPRWVGAGNVAPKGTALVHTLAVTTPPVASVVASYEKSADESGLGLVHYLTPQGDAALLHRSLDDLPPGEQAQQTVFEDVQRISTPRPEHLRSGG